jgi:hypothetical protein
VVTGRSGNASREVVESGAKRANRVVASWMLAFAIVTRRARRLFRETSAVDAQVNPRIKSGDVHDEAESVALFWASPLQTRGRKACATSAGRCAFRECENNHLGDTTEAQKEPRARGVRARGQQGAEQGRRRPCGVL